MNREVRRGRFIAPIADLSAPYGFSDIQIILLVYIIGPRWRPILLMTSHNNSSSVCAIQISSPGTNSDVWYNSSVPQNISGDDLDKSNEDNGEGMWSDVDASPMIFKR